MPKEIVVYPIRGHLLKIDDKYYKLKKEKKGEDQRTVVEEVYEEVAPEAKGIGKGEGYWVSADEHAFLPGMGEAVETSVAEPSAPC